MFSAGAQTTKLFSQLQVLPVVKELHSAMLLFCTSLLMAGEMSLWLGPALKFLQQSWAGSVSSPVTAEEFSTHPLAFTLKLHLCLSDSGWGGWKMVALPLVMRSTLRSDAGLAQYAPRQLLAFAASLKREKNITPADSDTVWRTKLETLAMERLQGGKWKDGNAVDAVSPLVTSRICPSLILSFSLIARGIGRHSYPQSLLQQCHCAARR